MTLISFGYTSPPFMAGAKTKTRRTWTSKRATSMLRGSIHSAWSRDPRNVGAERLGRLKLLRQPTFEPMTAADPEETYRAEGFEWLDRQWESWDLGEGPLYDATLVWCRTPWEYWVVDFEAIERRAALADKYKTFDAIIDSVNALMDFLPEER
jgi:hypothetical protein